MWADAGASVLTHAGGHAVSAQWRNTRRPLHVDIVAHAAGLAAPPMLFVNPLMTNVVPGTSTCSCQKRKNKLFALCVQYRVGEGNEMRAFVLLLVVSQVGEPVATDRVKQRGLPCDA